MLRVTSSLEPGDTRRRAAVRAGVIIEVVTVSWMTVEAAVAIAAGLLARSVLLTTFGLDSVIELVTGGVLLWRLVVETRGSALTGVERAEKRSAWLTGIALALLCLYVAISAAAALVSHAEPSHSIAGIALACLAVVAMPLLARRKRAIAGQIGSAALRGDAACSITCAYLAATLLVGLGLNAAFGWGWADPVAALALLYWLQREARGAIEGARSNSGGCGCGDASRRG